MYTYRSSCPLVSETLWPNESENAFFSKDSKQRQRSSKIPTLWAANWTKVRPSYSSYCNFGMGYRISDLGSGIVESEQSFRVADMFLQCIYRRQSPEHWDRVFTVCWPWFRAKTAAQDVPFLIRMKLGFLAMNPRQSTLNEIWISNKIMVKEFWDPWKKMAMKLGYLY